MIHQDVPSSAISLNSDTYLNHLSPREAIEYEATRNVVLVLLGATVWDILATFPDDIRVLKRSRLRFSTFCFIFSRCFSVAYVISTAIRRVTPIRNLYAAVLLSGVLGALSIACSSFLFLQRILAVYADSPRVRQFFTVFWIVYLLSYSLIVYSLKPAYIPQTQHFKHSGVQPSAALTGIITSIAYDSSVFLAISYKIGIAHVVIDREMGWRRFISGRALPRLSQAVLRGGQQYYLILFLVIVPSGIFLYVPWTPPMFKSMLSVFFAPLMASMSCRAHRNIKLFEYDMNATPPYPLSEIQFA